MKTYRKPLQKVASIRVSGPDHKGIIATITGYLFQKGLNIEDIDQQIRDNFLTMNMRVEYSSLSQDVELFRQGLQKVATSVGMEVEFRPWLEKARKKIALFVTHEAHCLEMLLAKIGSKDFPGNISLIVGNHPTLKKIAIASKTPFFHIPSTNKRDHENQILELLRKYPVDLIVLARYMQILSPDFVFRYEGRIINIHPSLLPAFPGPRSYQQAFNKGVEVVGVTAHFVTTNLDEGPIICQDSFRVDKTRDTLELMTAKGRALEAKVLTQAVKLFLNDRLCLRRGKVLDRKKMRVVSFCEEE